MPRGTVRAVQPPEIYERTGIPGRKSPHLPQRQRKNGRRPGGPDQGAVPEPGHPHLRGAGPVHLSIDLDYLGSSGGQFKLCGRIKAK